MAWTLSIGQPGCSVICKLNGGPWISAIFCPNIRVDKRRSVFDLQKKIVDVYRRRLFRRQIYGNSTCLPSDDIGRARKLHCGMSEHWTIARLALFPTTISINFQNLSVFCDNYCIPTRLSRFLSFLVANRRGTLNCWISAKQSMSITFSFCR